MHVTSRFNTGLCAESARSGVKFSVSAWDKATVEASASEVVLRSVQVAVEHLAGLLSKSLSQVVVVHCNVGLVPCIPRDHGRFFCRRELSQTQNNIF